MIPCSEDPDHTRDIVRGNLARIKLITVAGTALLHDHQADRALRVIWKRCEYGTEPPLVMIAVHNGAEANAAKAFAGRLPNGPSQCHMVRQDGHNETVGNAIRLYRERFDPHAEPSTAKRFILCLKRRGGKGKPTFISQFTGGQGTTCGEWTPVLDRDADGRPIQGFMKANLSVGFCPVECPFCYLQMPYTDGMDVALNWEDLATELASEKWRGFNYPISFGETGGLVEYDEWFADEHGNGSMIQFVIDACAQANVTPFFLTKIRFPRYLVFNGRVQVGISLMPEPIRRSMAPYGSPSDELLDSLAWSVSRGAVDPVIRLLVIWQERELYPELLGRCREKLGRSGWRLTLDILRFTPSTASIIARRHPDAATLFADELSPETPRTLTQLVREAKASEERVKKIRPPAARQAEIFRWFREQLSRAGCPGVWITPCKADPAELAPLVREKVAHSMPCACCADNQGGLCNPTDRRRGASRLVGLDAPGAADRSGHGPRQSTTIQTHQKEKETES